MLCSERATVLSEHHKALVSQGKRTDLLKEIETMLKTDDTRDESTSRLLGKRSTSADGAGRNYNHSGRTASRHLRICNFIEELKERLEMEPIKNYIINTIIKHSQIIKKEQIF